MKFQELASQIAKMEGKKDEETIGNVREQLKLVLTTLANLPFAEVAKLLSKYQKRAKTYLKG